jgi:UDP-2,3-diacylglucosamine hydrolase
MSGHPMIELDLPEGKSIFFASDFHLGGGNEGESRIREKELVCWLRSIKSEVAYLFLVGDVFDYWFEYKSVVPKGNIRLMGELANLADEGIPIYYFTGNHDMWMRDYFEKELNAFVSRVPVTFEVSSGAGKHRFFVGHGDGLGPGDSTYKLLKVLFESKVARALFRQVHPDLASRLAFAWSGHSRAANTKKGEDGFKGEAYEWLYQYCLEVECSAHHDYYVFGHRHLALDLRLPSGSRYINLGEWFSKDSSYPYARFSGNEMALTSFR